MHTGGRTTDKIDFNFSFGIVLATPLQARDRPPPVGVLTWRGRFTFGVINSSFVGLPSAFS
jgi:hypothetical protein